MCSHRSKATQSGERAAARARKAPSLLGGGPLRLTIAFAALSWVSCASLQSGGSYSRDPWLELQSEHFALRTQLEEPAAQKLVLALERYRAGMLLALGAEVQTAKLQVVALAGTRELAQLGYAEDIRGVTRFGGGALLGLVPTHEMSTVPMGPVQAHELAHYFTSYVFPHQPPWFSEGLAEYLATLALSEDGREVIVGRPNLPRLRRGQPPMDLAALWDWLPSVTDTDVESNAAGYASSWLWVHFLLNAHTDRFVAFMQGLAGGKPPREAFARAFEGVNEAELNGNVTRYQMRTQKYEIYRHVLPPIAGAFSVRDMSPAEGLLARYQLAATTKAKDEVAAALQQQAPESAEAALVAMENARTGEAREAALAALASRHGSDPRTAVALAEEARDLPAAERDALTARAISFAPGDPIAIGARLNYLASLYPMPPEAVPLAASLSRLAPWSPSALALCTAVAARAGRCPEAENLAGRAAAALSEGTAESARATFQQQLRAVVELCSPPKASR